MTQCECVLYSCWDSTNTEYLHLSALCVQGCEAVWCLQQALAEHYWVLGVVRGKLKAAAVQLLMLVAMPDVHALVWVFGAFPNITPFSLLWVRSFTVNPITQVKELVLLSFRKFTMVTGPRRVELDGDSVIIQSPSLLPVKVYGLDPTGSACLPTFAVHSALPCAAKLISYKRTSTFSIVSFFMTVSH